MNCVSDHIHLLVSLGKEQSISNIALLIKGESSFWVNKHVLIPQKFQWQEEYFAVSVGESGLDKVRKYIAAQEEHHRKKTFAEEYEFS
jgi:REP element-mobilizing transposase RayT